MSVKGRGEQRRSSLCWGPGNGRLGDRGYGSPLGQTVLTSYSGKHTYTYVHTETTKKMTSSAWDFRENILRVSQDVLSAQQWQLVGLVSTDISLYDDNQTSFKIFISHEFHLVLILFFLPFLRGHFLKEVELINESWIVLIQISCSELNN